MCAAIEVQVVDGNDVTSCQRQFRQVAILIHVRMHFGSYLLIRMHGIYIGGIDVYVFAALTGTVLRAVLYELHHEKTGFFVCENKGEDQLCSNCTADQRLCFHYMNSTIPLSL